MPHPAVPSDANNPFQYIIGAMQGVGVAAGAGGGGGGGVLGAIGGGAAAAPAAPAAGTAAGQLPQPVLPTGDGVSAYFGMPGGGKSVLIHYEGYKSRYDEWITTQSPRLAPFRSCTTRPLSVTMQSVEEVVHGSSGRCVWASISG